MPGELTDKGFRQGFSFWPWGAQILFSECRDIGKMKTKREIGKLQVRRPFAKFTVRRLPAILKGRPEKLPVRKEFHIHHRRPPRLPGCVGKQMTTNANARKNPADTAKLKNTRMEKRRRRRIERVEYLRIPENITASGRIGCERRKRLRRGAEKMLAEFGDQRGRRLGQAKFPQSSQDMFRGSVEPRTFDRLRQNRANCLQAQGKAFADPLPGAKKSRNGRKTRIRENASHHSSKLIFVVTKLGPSGVPEGIFNRQGNVFGVFLVPCVSGIQKTTNEFFAELLFLEGKMVAVAPDKEDRLPGGLDHLRLRISLMNSPKSSIA